MALNRLKAGRGLQPVPEESGVNGTSSTWPAGTPADYPASSAKLQTERSRDADRRCGNTTTACRFRSPLCAEGGGSDESVDNVSEKDYRIWFPRAEVTDDDAASRCLSDWRTFREYRYTECAQNGRLEKTLSVEQVHKSKNIPMADSQQTTVSFQCAPCSTGNEGDGGDRVGGEVSRVLSSTKGQLYREHHTQLLSRLEDDSTPEAQTRKVDVEPKLTSDQAGIGGEKEECQTHPEKSALANSSVETVLDNSLANETDVSSAAVDSLLNEQDVHSSQLGSAGFHDATAMSEDDELDEQKSTYVRADNVDSEVEVLTSELKGTVVGGPSLDDLGYIAEEPEDEIDESASDSEERKIVSIVDKERIKKSDEARMPCSDIETRTGVVCEAGATSGSSENYKHIEKETVTHSDPDVTTGLDGESQMCDKEQMQSSQKEETEKQGVCRSEEPNIVNETLNGLHEPSLETQVLSNGAKEVDRTEERPESLNLTSAENKSIKLESVNAGTDSANEGNSAGTPVDNLERHSEPLSGKAVSEVPAEAFAKEAEARSEVVEFSKCNEGIKEDLQRTPENAPSSTLLRSADDLLQCGIESAHGTNSLEENDKAPNFQVGTIEDRDGALCENNEVLEVQPSNGDEDPTAGKGQEEKDTPTSLAIPQKDGQETANTLLPLEMDTVSSEYISTDAVVRGRAENEDEAGDAHMPAPDLQESLNASVESVQAHLAPDPSHLDNVESLTRSEESMFGVATCRESENEATQEAYRSGSAIGVDSLSSKDFPSVVTAEVIDENGELSGSKEGLEKKRLKNETERPEDVCNRKNEMLEPDILHINKGEPLTQSKDTQQDAAWGHTQVIETIKELENVSATVETSVSKKDVFLDAEPETVKENDEVLDELEKAPQQSMPESLEKASGEMTENDTINLSEANPEMGVEESMQDSAVRHSDVNEAGQEGLESSQGVSKISVLGISSSVQTKHTEENEKQWEINEALQQDLRSGKAEVPSYSLPEKGEILQDETIQFAKVQFVIDGQEKVENIFTCHTNVEQPIPMKRKSLSDISKESPFNKSVFQEETITSLIDEDEKMKTSLQTEENCHGENVAENVESREGGSSKMLRENDEFTNHDMQLLNEKTEPMEQADGPVGKAIMVEDSENSAQLSEEKMSAFEEAENTPTQDPEKSVSTKLNDQELQPANVEVKAQDACPAANICHLGDSTSLSIEANMLKDVMELNGIEDATSLDTSLQEDNDQGCESLPFDETTKRGDVNKSCTSGVQELEVSEKSNDENPSNFDALEGTVGQDLSTGVGLPATTTAEDMRADIMDHKENLLEQHARSSLEDLNADDIQGTSQVALQSEDVKENEETSLATNGHCVENEDLLSSEDEKARTVHPGPYETNKTLEVTEVTNVSEERTCADQEDTVNGSMKLVNGNHVDSGCQLENLSDETNSAYEVEGSENKELANEARTTEDLVKFIPSESIFFENKSHEAETAASHDAFDVIEDATVEANVKVPVRVFEEAYLEREEKEERLKLRAYAEDIVSTVLTKCVTQLEENAQKFTVAGNTNKNQDDLNAFKLSESSGGESEENQTVASTKPEIGNEHLLSGDLGPIASRQSAFEKDMPPDNCQDIDVKDEGLQTVFTTTADKNTEEINEELILRKRQASLSEPERSDRVDADLLISVDNILETSVDDLPFSGVSLIVPQVRTQGENEPDVQPEDDISEQVRAPEVLTEEMEVSENESKNSAGTIKTNREILYQDDDIPEREEAQRVHPKMLPGDLPDITNGETHNVDAGSSPLVVGIETCNNRSDVSATEETKMPTTSEILLNSEASSENVAAAQKEHDDDIPDREEEAQGAHPKMLPTELPDMTNGETHNDDGGSSPLFVGIETANNKNDVSAREETKMLTTSEILLNSEASSENVAAAQTEHDDDIPDREEEAQGVHPKMLPTEIPDMANGETHNDDGGTSPLFVGIETASNKNDVSAREETKMPTASEILLNSEASSENVAAAQKEHDDLARGVPVPEERAVDAGYHTNEVPTSAADVTREPAAMPTFEKENALTEGERSPMGDADASEELGTKDATEDAAVDNKVREDDSANAPVPVVGEGTKVEQRSMDMVYDATVENTNEVSSHQEYSLRTDHDFSVGWEPQATDDNATMLHLDDSALQDQDSRLSNISSKNIGISNDCAAQQTGEEHALIIREHLSVADSEMFHHSDKNSLGALSTVYENSLEDFKSNVEEDVTGTDTTTKFNSNQEAVDTIANHELPLHNIADNTGGIFRENESSPQNDQILDPSESSDSSESSPLQRASNIAIENVKADEEAVEASYTETRASYNITDDLGVQVNDGVVRRSSGADNFSARMGPGYISDNCHAVESATLQTPEDAASLQEVKDKDTGHEQGLSSDLQSKTEPEVSHDSQGTSTDNDATHEKDITVVQKKELKMSADDDKNEVIATFDTLADGTERVMRVLPEQHEPRAPNEHQQLHQDNQASEDEVAAIDFSDEEHQSLEQINWNNYEDIRDLQEMNGGSGSHEVRKITLEEGVQSNSVSLQPRFVAVSDNDDREGITYDTGVETRDQFDKSREECSVHGSEKPSDHVSNFETSLAGSQDKSQFDSRQATIGTLKTAVLVHEATKLETVEWSEDPLNSVATEADFSSDVYEQTADGQNASISDAQSCGQITDGLVNLSEGKALNSSGYQKEICQPTDIAQELGRETEELRHDPQEAEEKSSSNMVEEAIVPQHIDTSNDKPSSTDSEVESERGKNISNEKDGNNGKEANTDLKDAIEKFSTIISSEGAGLAANTPTSQGTVDGLNGSVVTEVPDQHVITEKSEDEAEREGHPSSSATDAKLEHDSENERKAEDAKPGYSESIHLGSVDQNNFGHEDTQRLKEDTTHSVSESVEKSERTEREDAASHERSSLTRIFHRTVLRTESTRTVRKTRSFMPYSRDKDTANTRAGHEVEAEPVAQPRTPVEETYVARQAFDVMSIPRPGLGPVPSTEMPRTVRDVGVQTLPSTTEKEVQVEFNEHDCIARLVELQIAMNEQEEVRRQDMKAACELVEKLEAMTLSESLMRSQIRAMDVERREQSAREARLRDELQAWQETVQQQQLLLQQLKEDLDDTEDTLAAQRQEANRLRERMLVLQESCDSGLLMADVLTRADKEVQTPDGAQHPLSASYKGSRADDGSPVYLGQLEQHRRLSALVSSQLEATANRIAQLRREAEANRSMARAGGTLDDYMHDLAVRFGQDAPPT